MFVLIEKEKKLMKHQYIDITGKFYMNLQRKCWQLYKPDILLANIDPTLEPETGAKGELEEGETSKKTS